MDYDIVMGKGGGGASLSRGLRCEFSPVLFFLHA